MCIVGKSTARNNSVCDNIYIKNETSGRYPILESAALKTKAQRPRHEKRNTEMKNEFELFFIEGTPKITCA